MTNFNINQTTINSEIKYAVKAIRKEYKPNKVTFLPYEILYLEQPDHMALRVHYVVDGENQSKFYGIAI